jgi:hypothetical protein
MPKIFILALVTTLLPFVGTQAEAILNCASGGTCNYGDTGPGGGKVFITPSTSGNSTGKYFELAPASTEAVAPWCGNGAGVRNTSTLIGTATGIGTGKTNTDAIVAFCGGASAADSATAYRGGGFSDWFLPSKDELNATYLNLKVGGLDTFSAGDVYTSSSESTTTTVWMQDINEVYGPRLTSGYFQKNFTKNAGSWYPIYNRPVRMFSPGDSSNSGSSSGNSNDEVRRQRDEDVRKAKIELVDLVKRKEEVKNSNLIQCDHTPLSSDSLARANKDFKLLASVTISNVERIVIKYQLFDKLEAQTIPAVYPRDLVKYEVINASTPRQGVLISELKSLDFSLRNTPEKIAALVAEHTRILTTQKNRLSKRLQR